MKNQAISSFCSTDIDLKIMQSDWPREFWRMYQKPDFPHTLDLYRHIVKNVNSYHRPNKEKFNNKIFQ